MSQLAFPPFFHQTSCHLFKLAQNGLANSTWPKSQPVVKHTQWPFIHPINNQYNMFKLSFPSFSHQTSISPFNMPKAHFFFSFPIATCYQIPQAALVPALTYYMRHIWHAQTFHFKKFPSDFTSLSHLLNFTPLRHSTWPNHKPSSKQLC